MIFKSLKKIIFDVMSKELLTFLKCCNPTLLLSAGLTLGFKASLFVERADPNACIQFSKACFFKLPNLSKLRSCYLRIVTKSNTSLKITFLDLEVADLLISRIHAFENRYGYWILSNLFLCQNTDVGFHGFQRMYPSSSNSAFTLMYSLT